MRKTKMLLSAAWIAAAAGPVATALALPAFPGAQGFGANAVGGRNGDVYHVTSLADTNTSGTLRFGINNAPAGGRTIVFDVGGSIILESNLTVNKSNLTIAGQTAPGPGINIINKTPANNPSSLFYKFQVSSSTGQTLSNVIVRYLTVRRGINSISASTDDAVGILGSGTTRDIILDHMSASWGTDENLSPTNNSTNITVQHSYMTEALNPNSHAYGTLVRPQINSSMSFNHNLWADNLSRNPRIGNYNGSLLQFDFRNNVVYNWGSRASYTGGASETDTEFTDANYVGNYFIAGPSSSNTTSGFYLQTDADPVYVRMFQATNKIDSNKNASRDGTDTGWGMFIATGGAFPVDDPFGKRMASEFAFVGNDYIVTDSADDAYAKILAAGGGSLPGTKSAIDARIAGQMTSNPNTGAIINAPTGSEWDALYNAVAVSRPVGWDTDNDGMPTWWETARGLDPNVAGATSTSLTPGSYTNLEHYLDYLTLVANWNVNANANWGGIVNWLGSVPNAVDATANFGPGITTARTITVESAKTVGQISFNSGFGYTIAGAGANAVTMDVISGAATIDVLSGSHTISAPLVLNDDLNVTVIPGASTLTLSSLGQSSKTITKSGAGKLVVNRVRAGALNVQQGVVAIAPHGGNIAVSVVNTLSITPGAGLDLADNDLVVQAGNFGVMQGQVIAGFGNPTVGITSSTSNGSQILALFDNALVGAGSWAGQPISANAVVGKYTYFGDANIDGQVTGDDYTVIDANLNTTPAAGLAWLSGDMNLDGTVTGDDYTVIDANLGLGVGNPLTMAAVPEPGGMIALIASGFSLALRQRRKQRDL